MSRMDRNTCALIAFVAVAVGIAMPSVAADHTEKVHLPAGGHSVSRSGEIEGNHTFTYVVSGKKGQSLNVDFVPTDGTCGFDLYAPNMAVPIYLGGPAASAFSGTLSENGDYRINIHMGDAGAHGKSCRFNVAFKSRG